MSALAHCGSSAATAGWQLNLRPVSRASSLSAANILWINRVGDSCESSTDGMSLTPAIWNDSSQYKECVLSVPKAFISSSTTRGLQREDGHGLRKIGLRNEPVMGNGKFHLILNINNKTGLVVKCSIHVPNLRHGLCQKDSIGNIGGEQSMNPSTESERSSGARGRVKAAFFDVDGTITGTNVVLAYFAVRMSELSYLRKLYWVPCFAVLCIFYLLVDNFDRATFNRIFYSNHYKGRSVDSKSSIAALVYERYYKPRIFAGALEHIRELKQLGYHIVLVTGALDFHMAPLARDLEADFVYAAELVEENGSFTGKLNGMATSNSEKAERVLDYAKRFDVSLEDSLAFGDSIADVSMLEMVGRPHAVNPDARLMAISLQRKWTILSWTLQALKATTAAEPLLA